MPSPMVPPAAALPPPMVPYASRQCTAACMPDCLPTCTQQMQTAQIAVPCGTPCICQPGYMQCAETMCCLKYKSKTAKFSKLKTAANNNNFLSDDDEQKTLNV
ncbi:unnamed protein product [Nippostrongylus brasiliensis]|uniref:TIL domain-containing protein n=1 Tax=Nippostrongylus brasiliensis TaxID=27835 RepID=A0A158QZ65_NIPBR|nr:unnamed protein product [Nippostrongylus brasiliensis]